MASRTAAEPIARTGQVAGAVIARKSGEEVRFIDVSNWRYVDLQQDLKTGDVLRTNPTGQLAILFSDRTQVRLARNSSLVVKQITASTSADTILELQSGTIWARAERGGPGVRVETPAAAAAIRGTDWTMTVNGSQTSLTVLEGIVQLANPQGTVDVRQGEGAVASIGQAPRKVVIVNSDDREQMLFYMPPREAFRRMQPSAAPVAQMRRNADTITAIAPDRRSTDDWVTLAEAQLALEGRAATKATLGVLRSKSLSLSQKARVTLMDAILAANEARYGEAARLFATAERGLDSRRRAIALYGGYYARSLANPNRVEPLPPTVDGPQTAFLRAYAVGFLQDIRAAIKVLAEAEIKYPADAQLPAYRAWLAVLLNDRSQAEEAMSRSLAIDPHEPTALEIKAYYKAGVKSDIKGALADIQTAIQIAPGDSSNWNALGTLQSQRGANREAEAALRRAIQLDPEDPIAHANLAIFYLDLNRVEEARQEIDFALQRDPTLSIGLIARGRYHIQTGETDKAIDDLLAGTVADPGYASGQLLLAAAHFQKGDRIAAGQAVDNADRLDGNDPVIAAARTAVAIDNYDSHGAIRNAQEYVRRGRARGGEYTSLGANQQAGSILNDAFRFQGLNSWAEYYTDAVFDPFTGTSYIDQAIRGSANPFANSYFYGQDNLNNAANAQAFSPILQGLLLDPHLISSQSLGLNLLARPFMETELSGAINLAGGKVSYEYEANLQSYTNLPFPMSFNGTLQWQRTADSRNFGGLTDLNNEIELLGGTVFLTASPTPYDRVVTYYTHARNELTGQSQANADAAIVLGVAFPLPLTIQQDMSTSTTNGGVGWSHTFEYQNVLNAGLLYSGAQSRSQQYLEFDFFGLFPAPVWTQLDRAKQDTYVAAVNHSVKVDDLAWRYGVEGGWTSISQSQAFSPGFALIIPANASISERTAIGRVYVDLLHDIAPDLKAEYGLFGTYVESNDENFHFDPRIGLAWSPTQGQWLRAGFLRNSLDFATPTLSPIGVVGLQPNQISIDPGGRVDTYAFRWDSEWTKDFFTAVEHQYQEAKDVTIGVPLQSFNYTTGEGRIDRTSLTANLLLDHGFGLSSTVAYASSRDTDSTSATFRKSLPFVPQWGGQMALTWVNEANVKAQLAANYIGNRSGSNGTNLDPYWSMDASLTWEPLEKHVELELAAFNILNQGFTIDRDVFGNPVPGWGRSFKGTLRVRF